MPYTYQPPNAPNCAYRTILFETQVASANPVEYAFAILTINSVVQPTIEKPCISSSGINYNFGFDVQSLVQRALSPFTDSYPDAIGSINNPYTTLVSDSFAEFSLSVTYKYRDPITGLLVGLGITDVSATHYATNAARQFIDNTDTLDAYKPNDQTRQWLTLNPNIQFATAYAVPPRIQYLHPSDNAWVNFLAHPTADRLRVVTFDIGFNLLEQGIFSVDISPNNEPQAIGIGMANLLTQVYDVSGAVNMADPDIYFYRIDLLDAANTRMLNQLIIYVNRECRGECRLHWLNPLGGYDFYTFPKIQRKTENIAFTEAQRPVNTLVNYSDQSRFKLASEGITSYEAISDPLDQEDAAFLRWLGMSVSVWLETDTGLYPVVVTVKEVPVQVYENGTINKVFFVVSFDESKSLITQTN